MIRPSVALQLEEEEEERKERGKEEEEEEEEQEREKQIDRDGTMPGQVLSNEYKYMKCKWTFVNFLFYCRRNWLLHFNG